MKVSAEPDHSIPAAPAGHTQRVRRYFAEPDRYLGHDSRMTIRRVTAGQMVQGVDRSRLLDIGCGDGSMSLPLLDPGADLTLLDFSAPMLERAKANIPPGLEHQVTTVCGDLHEFSPDRRYTLVLCLGVLAHVRDVGQTLAKIASLLQPGGHCLLQITDTSRWLGRINYTYYGWRSRTRGEDGYTLNRLGSDGLITSAEAAGLRLVNRRNYSLAVPVLSRLPDELLLRLERKFLNSRLSRHGGESLLLFDV